MLANQDKSKIYLFPDRFKKICKDTGLSDTKISEALKISKKE